MSAARIYKSYGTFLQNDDKRDLWRLMRIIQRIIIALLVCFLSFYFGMVTTVISIESRDTFATTKNFLSKKFSTISCALLELRYQC